MTDPAPPPFIDSLYTYLIPRILTVTPTPHSPPPFPPVLPGLRLREGNISTSGKHVLLYTEIKAPLRPANHPVYTLLHIHSPCFRFAKIPRSRFGRGVKANT
jgi:hypothetical protein